MVKFFFHQIHGKMMTFLNPLDALIPKNPFSFFADFWVWVTSEAPGVSLSRILGVPSIEPLGWPWGSIDPPPPFTTRLPRG